MDLHKLVNGIQVPLTPEEIEDFYERERLHTLKMEEMARLEYQRLREQAYPRIEELVVALVEKEDGRPEALEALMELRRQVKIQYPKTGV